MRAPLLKRPANDVGEPGVIEIGGDGKQLVKLIALGMFTGGMHVIQHVGGLRPSLRRLAPWATS